MADQQDVDALARQLLEDLQIDWVSIPRMPWFAARILGHGETPRTTRELVVAALLELVADPAVRVVDGDMSRELTTRDELIRHLDAEWPDDGSPIEGDIGWLVERDFVLRQGDESSD